MMCFIEKIMFDKFYSGLSYNAVGCECSVPESTVQYTREKKEEVYISVCEPAPERAKLPPTVLKFGLYSDI